MTAALTLSARLALAELHLSESEARARVAEGAAEMAIKEAGEWRRWCERASLHLPADSEHEGDDGPDGAVTFRRALVAALDGAAAAADHIEVTPALRAAVEAVREARRLPCKCPDDSTERCERCRHEAFAVRDVANLILSALPPVKP